MLLSKPFLWNLAMIGGKTAWGHMLTFRGTNYTVPPKLLQFFISARKNKDRERDKNCYNYSCPDYTYVVLKLT